MDGIPMEFSAPHGGTLFNMSVAAAGQRARKVEENVGTAGYLISRSERRAVPFRVGATNRQWAGDIDYPQKIVEIGLAQAIGARVERACQRFDILHRRRATPVVRGSGAAARRSAAPAMENSV